MRVDTNQVGVGGGNHGEHKIVAPGHREVEVIDAPVGKQQVPVIPLVPLLCRKVGGRGLC